MVLNNFLQNTNISYREFHFSTANKPQHRFHLYKQKGVIQKFQKNSGLNIKSSPPFPHINEKSVYSGQNKHQTL